MKQIEYVNSIPPIPEHLLESFLTIKEEVHGKGHVDENNQWIDPNTPGSRQVTSITRLPEELIQWVKDNVPFECVLTTDEAYYLSIYPNMPIHRDYFLNDPNVKHIGLNYLIKLGGDNVVTKLYDDDEKTVLQSIRLEERKWIKFPICINHAVENVTEPPRIMVRITPAQSVNWDDIK